MFGINANLKRNLVVAVIALTGVMGAANASAQQLWMEEVLEKQLQEQEAARAEQDNASKGSETADREGEKEPGSNDASCNNAS